VGKTIKVIKLVMDTKFKAALSPTLKIILLEGKELGRKGIYNSKFTVIYTFINNLNIT
jgi:hypothetical protein